MALLEVTAVIDLIKKKRGDGALERKTWSF